MADVTNEQHQNMDGLVQADDFNPEVVVLGGKISQSDTLFNSALRTARASAVGSIMAAARIVRAELGDNAGIMGAAELAWREVEKK